MMEPGITIYTVLPITPPNKRKLLRRVDLKFVGPRFNARWVWCLKNTTAPWEQTTDRVKTEVGAWSKVFRFLSLDDAVLFKMKFGGELRQQSTSDLHHVQVLCR